MYRKNTSGQHIGFVAIKAADGTALTGATVTVRRSIDGAAQAATTGSVTELANGQYDFAPSAADLNGNNISFLFTATSMIPFCIDVVTTAADPTDSVRFGLTALPNAAAAASGGLLTAGTGSNQISTDGSGNVKLQASDSMTLHTGTAQAGASTSVTLAAGASSVTDYYKGAVIRFVSGTGAGQSTRVITGYNGTTKVATVGRAFATTPDATTVYVVQSEQSPVLGANLDVLVQAGTGTGQIDMTSGVIKANLVQILATALTETVGGYLAAAFKKLYDVATPVLTAASVNQTGDSYARLGAPAGASTAADIAAINAKTTNLPASPASTTNITAATGITVATNNDKTGYALTAGEHTNIATDTQTGLTAQGYTSTRAGYLDTLNGIVQAIWDKATSAITTVGSIGKQIKDNLDVVLSTRLATSGYTAPDNTSIAAIKAKTDNLPASPAAVSDIPTAATNASTLLASTVETGATVLQSLRIANAANAGKVDGAATTTMHLRDLADTKNRVTATVDANGNRTAITTDLT